MFKPTAVLVTLVAAVALAAPGDWKRVGKKGAWTATLGGNVLDGKLYTIESTGGLFVTDPGTGDWKLIGKPEFGNTVWLFGAAGSLYTIENDGSLYRINPKDGSWVGVGAKGGWAKTIAGAELDGHLYTVAKNGVLSGTDVATGTTKSIGKPEFQNTAVLLGLKGMLYSIETNGSLFAINPKDGTWSQRGKKGEWGPTIVIAAAAGKLYSVETSGALYATEPSTGAWKQIGKREFQATRGMFGIGSKLYTIENDGSLYAVSID